MNGWPVTEVASVDLMLDLAERLAVQRGGGTV